MLPQFKYQIRNYSLKKVNTSTIFQIYKKGQNISNYLYAKIMA